MAILPAGGTYTMNAVEAAEATQYIQPELAIPYHWGRNVGTLSDAQTFAQEAACAVKILTVGETISSDNWPKYSPLIAHWELEIAQKTGFFPHSNENFSKIAIIPALHPSLYVRTRPGKYRNRSKLVPVKPVLDSNRGTGIGETVKC